LKPPAARNVRDRRPPRPSPAVIAAVAAIACLLASGPLAADQPAAPAANEPAANEPAPAASTANRPADAEAPTEAAAPAESNAAGSAADGPATPERDAEPPRQDPFTYERRGGDGFVQPADAAIPTGIRLLGVIVMQGEKPIAAIRVPASDDVLYVREGSVIQIASRAQAGEQQSEAVYIYVNRITVDEVEVSPRMRPDYVRILR
jgi:hypothetical protein